MFKEGATSPKFLVTLPVLNEEKVLAHSTRRLMNELRACGLNFELAIAEDGSDDGTQKVMFSLMEEYPELILSSSPDRHGRGWALRNLWLSHYADYYIFVDADLPTSPSDVVATMRTLASGYDIVTGSRYLPESTTVRPPLRAVVSKIYNLVLRLVFQEPIRDHQCGLKGFNHAVIERLLRAVREESWFWDTEILVTGVKAGYRIVEMPVVWTESRNTRTGLLRLISDVYIHGTGILRLAGRVEELSKMASKPVKQSPILDA